MESQPSMSVESMKQNKRADLISSYENRSMHLSPSKIKAFYEGGPKGLLAYSLAEREQKTMYNEGNAIELLLMAPDDFEKSILVMDINSRPDTKVGMTGKKNLAWKKDLISQASQEGKIFLAKESVDKIKQTAKELKENPFLTQHFEFINQTQYKVHFDFKGWKILGYLDGLGQVIYDMKYSSTATNIAKVRNQFFNLKYWVPASLYHLGVKEQMGKDLPVIYGTIDQNNNYFPFEVLPEVLDWGLEKVEYTINHLERCIKDHGWDMGEEFFYMGSKSHCMPLTLPSWAK